MPGLTGYAGDFNYWRKWVIYTSEHGLSNAYGSGTDYLPLYHYVLWAFGKVMGDGATAVRHIEFLRIATLAVEFWGLYLVYRWIDKREDCLAILVLSICNIGYSYNTLIWGQVDAISSVGCFAALFYLYRGRAVISALMMILALNMKLQSIVFVPLWGLLFIEHLARTRRWSDLLRAALVIIITQVLLVLPFMFGQGGIHAVWRNVLHLVGSQSSISCNASNVWYWIVPGYSKVIPVNDNGILLWGMSYRAVGLIAFSTALLITHIPLIRYTWRSILNKSGSIELLPPSREMIWLTGALSALLFFFLNTEMHERYAHPAGIFLTAFAFYTRRWLAYVLFSIAVFLNLEMVLKWLALPNYGTLIFDQRFIAAMYAVVIILLARMLHYSSRTVDRNNPACILPDRPDRMHQPSVIP